MPAAPVTPARPARPVTPPSPRPATPPVSAAVPPTPAAPAAAAPAAVAPSLPQPSAPTASWTDGSHEEPAATEPSTSYLQAPTGEYHAQSGSDLLAFPTASDFDEPDRPTTEERPSFSPPPDPAPAAAPEAAPEPTADVVYDLAPAATHREEPDVAAFAPDAPVEEPTADERDEPVEATAATDSPSSTSSWSEWVPGVPEAYASAEPVTEHADTAPVDDTGLWVPSSSAGGDDAPQETEESRQEEEPVAQADGVEEVEEVEEASGELAEAGADEGEAVLRSHVPPDPGYPTPAAPVYRPEREHDWAGAVARPSSPGIDARAALADRIIAVAHRVRSGQVAVSGLELLDSDEAALAAVLAALLAGRR